MSTIDHLHNKLIEKILSIQNEDYLMALDNFLTSQVNSNFSELSEVQKQMLDKSESDIEEGRLISQEAMNRRNLEWLNEL
ncbi:hypothetical protein GC194_09365 [bacterium]|nr:hypothetical protein [bacterium]